MRIVQLLLSLLTCYVNFSNEERIEKSVWSNELPFELQLNIWILLQTQAIRYLNINIRMLLQNCAVVHTITFALGINKTHPIFESGKQNLRVEFIEKYIPLKWYFHDVNCLHLNGIWCCCGNRKTSQITLSKRHFIYFMSHTRPNQT